MGSVIGYRVHKGGNSGVGCGGLETSPELGRLLDDLHGAGVLRRKRVQDHDSGSTESSEGETCLPLREG